MQTAKQAENVATAATLSTQRKKNNNGRSTGTRQTWREGNKAANQSVKRRADAADAIIIISCQPAR